MERLMIGLIVILAIIVFGILIPTGFYEQSQYVQKCEKAGYRSIITRDGPTCWRDDGTRVFFDR